MFVKTVKVKKPNPIAICIIIVGILILVAIKAFGAAGNAAKTYKLATNADRYQFLTDLGWEVSNEATESKMVTIPTKFNTVYNVYNKIQKEQGFDLKDYSGKAVEIYTYSVYNYPNKPDNMVAHLMICDGILIGGDVCCIELDGFMQGLVPINREELNNSGAVSKVG